MLQLEPHLAACGCTQRSLPAGVGGAGRAASARLGMHDGAQGPLPSAASLVQAGCQGHLVCLRSQVSCACKADSL